MAKTLCLTNQKGGVGKTTTAVNLGAYLANFGRKVLIVDCDPQANATSGLGIDFRQIDAGTYDVLVKNLPLTQIILQTKIENYHLLPSSPSLAGASVELIQFDNREFRLKKALKEVQEYYDYIFVDCPPSLGLLTVNALTASDSVVIPVQCEYYALEGMSQLMHTIKLVQERLKPELKIMGVVLTMFDRRITLSRHVVNEMRKNFPGRVFDSIIPRNIRLAEAPSYGETIMEYDLGSRGARAYENLAKEIVKLEGITNHES
ncbi:chromosome partitioning protein [bacterium (Candidatus Torokbacteria) CG_4_10_14_0_2_um_filter_35_8]|uniref:Chromosome partitioning protein n=1 Tax=Candidatus Sherwoodlollariibacterium unditelluris TaxID=1974757 RepID=A0A2G9YKP9_9BACT|nr:MAG: chromosome partitioning protein [Candidatus Omnitrophica bacterium CG23_combo_of_CG06-09_8_20_14_all_41_10]PIZ58904.1 MAG: chromosome partitioning protein [bacterium (Candidatus Torokbacteria) CG_4_10_14_0_2_um_filter_35_8]